MPWSVVNTKLSHVNQYLNISLTDEINRLIEEKDGEEIVIVDWGCGMGNAIRELALYYRGHDNVKFYGFGDIYFPDWSRIPTYSNWILDKKENIGEYFDRNVDLMYSNLGLFHIDHTEFVEYFRTLEKTLSGNALLVGNYEGYPMEVFNRIRRMGHIVSTEKNAIGRVYKIRTSYFGAAIVASVKPVK